MLHPVTRRAARLVALIVASLPVLAPAAAQTPTVEQFYKGRTISMIIPSSPGGVNDIAGRLVAQFIGAHIPGKPSVVPQNLPGSSGIAGANRMYNSAEKDGSVISIVERGVPQVAILGDPNVKYQPDNFTWLGSISSYANDAYVLAINASLPIKTVEDLRKSSGISIQIGAMNPGTTNTTFALIARDLLGLPIKVVRGYTGAAPMFLAMATKELDGQVVGLAAMKAGQRSLWENRQVRTLVQFGRKTRLPELADVPTGRELITTPDDLALLEFAEQPFFIALPFIAPPGIPADRADALRKAFMETMADPGFVAAINRVNLEMSPIDGEQVRQLIAKAAATPKGVLKRYADIIGN